MQHVGGQPEPLDKSQFNCTSEEYSANYSLLSWLDRPFGGARDRTVYINIHTWCEVCKGQSLEGTLDRTSYYIYIQEWRDVMQETGEQRGNT